MRRLVVGISVLLALALAGAAMAVLPPAPSKFKGTTSAPRIMGFKSPMSFKVKFTRRSALVIRSFKFGSLGCFGAGGFPPGKNPYKTKGTTARIAGMAISRRGRFGKKTTIKLAGLPTKVKVKGKFISKGRRAPHYGAKGKITISQNDGTNSCGPVAVRFKARRAR